MLGHIQQRGVLELALDPVVTPGQRILEIVRYVFVERVVLIVTDITARTRPHGLRGIDALPLGFG